MRARLTTRTWFVIAPTLSVVLPMALAACGSGRNYDNPPEVSPITAGSSTSTTSATTTTTVFVPTTAPTTLGPVTDPPTAPPPPPPPVTLPPTAPPAPTTPPPTTGETYAVVGGDTLFGISRRLGVTLDALLAANNLTATSLITPGQRLQIPVGGSVPATNAPATNAPATNAPATNAPATDPPATNAPATDSPGTSPATSPQIQPTTTLGAAPGAVQPTGASATCQSPDSQEANGTPIVFAPGNVLDRNPATGWRCAAPATGQSLTITLDAATHLTSVGIIGGYDKKDPLTGVDRWTQNHRVRRVRLTFSDGTSTEQDLADSRGMQSINVDVTTTSVKIEILSTYPASGPDPKQTVVVAEVQLIGG